MIYPFEQHHKQTSFNADADIDVNLASEDSQKAIARSLARNKEVDSGLLPEVSLKDESAAAFKVSSSETRRRDDRLLPIVDERQIFRHVSNREFERLARTMRSIPEEYRGDFARTVKEVARAAGMTVVVADDNRIQLREGSSVHEIKPGSYQNWTIPPRPRSIHRPR